MCGIALLYGPTATQQIATTLMRIAHRGPDDLHTETHGQFAIGFVRLAINDESIAGRQPYKYGNWIGAFNGEIFNARALARKYCLATNSACDTHVVLPLYKQLGNKVLAELDGFYSGVIYKPGTHSLYLLRDHIGKKPLFYGCADDNLFVVSELKALKNIEWFQQVPLGLSQLQLTTGQLTQLARHPQPTGEASEFSWVSDSATALSAALQQAVIKRLPEQPCGFFLSGGLDSSIIAALANQHHHHITYFTLGNPGSPDVAMAEMLVKHLSLNHIHYVPLPTEQELPGLISRVVYATESYNPSIISNGIATYLLAQAVQKQGLKVVLTGEGADELFAGYHNQLSEPEWKAIRAQLIHDMPFTELRRLDTCSMANSIEARCPYLDRDVKRVADTLKHEQFFVSGFNKAILRKTFGHLLPDTITYRKKTSFDVGSGLRKLVVNNLTGNGMTEMAELKAIWQHAFKHDVEDKYFYSYPTFDVAIAKRGHCHR